MKSKKAIFEARRVHELRARSARGKQLIKDKGQVLTKVVRNYVASTLLSIIREKVNEISAIFKS